MIGVGDTVVCVNIGVIKGCPCGQKHLGNNTLCAGRVYRVARVGPADLVLNEWGCVSPVLVTTCGAGGDLARFRKVQPKSASKHIDRMKRVPSRQREDA